MQKCWIVVSMRVACFHSDCTCLRYEEEGRARKKVKAQKLWFAIMESQIETGTPYMLYKDACNRKSNQQVSRKTQDWGGVLSLCGKMYYT